MKRWLKAYERIAHRLNEPWMRRTHVNGFLDRYTFVETELWATPLTLANQLERLVEALRQADHSVLVRSVGTDFEFGFVPIPKAQKVIIGLDTTVELAKNAVRKAARSLNARFRILRTYVEELSREVIEPTVRDLRSTSSPVLLLFGAGVAAWLHGTAKSGVGPPK